MLMNYCIKKMPEANNFRINNKHLFWQAVSIVQSWREKHDVKHSLKMLAFHNVCSVIDWCYRKNECPHKAVEDIIKNSGKTCPVRVSHFPLNTLILEDKQLTNRSLL